jgi:hypothetical protein
LLAPWAANNARFDAEGPLSSETLVGPNATLPGAQIAYESFEQRKPGGEKVKQVMTGDA